MEKLKRLQWQFYCRTLPVKMRHYYQRGQVRPYDDALIARLRDVDYLGLPASVILLSHKLCNGHCHERAFLLAKAFFDQPDDIRLVQADVNSLRLKPWLTADQAEHCFLERVTPDGKEWVYDTTDGFVFAKDAYWQIEKPRVRRVFSKEELILAAADYEQVLEAHDTKAGFWQEADAALRYSIQTPDVGEIYARPGNPVLQRELKLFKEKVAAREAGATRE